MANSGSLSSSTGLTSMHKALIVILLIWFGVIPVGWYFEYHLGFSSNLVSNTSTVIQILGFLAILLVPWMKLPGQERLSNYERLSQTVILWIFIALSPMLGFLGTVIGMIQAFEQIVEDGQVSPITVAGGIQVSLLTTVFGLISAIILQIFYNYITSKVDGIVNEME